MYKASIEAVLDNVVSIIQHIIMMRTPTLQGSSTEASIGVTTDNGVQRRY